MDFSALVAIAYQVLGIVGSGLNLVYDGIGLLSQSA